MANKIIDVILQLKDNLTGPLAQASASMQSHANQWKRAGKDIQRTGKNIGRVGSTMTRSLTVPIVGAGAAAVKCSADFEKGMSDVMAIMDVTGAKAGKQRKQLEDNAKAMSKNGFAADEVAEAYKYMGMAGWKTKEILAGTEPIMKLAAATNTEVGRTSDIVTDALTAFGAKAKDTAKLTDILAKVSTSSNTNVEMLGETFKYAAPVAGAFNYSMAETAAVSGLMANAGIKASQAGTTLRSTMSNILAPTKQAADAMAQYGLNAKDMSKMPLQKQLETLRNTYKGLEKDEKAAFAKAIAGKNAMSGFMSIMKVSDHDFKTFSKNVKDASGATDRMFKTSMDNLTGQLKILKAELKNAGVAFGDVLLPTIKKAVSWLQKGTEWLKNLSAEEKEQIVKIAGIVAAVGPALIVFGKMTSVIGKVVSGLGAIAKAGGLLSFMTGPGGIVVAVLAAIAAAVMFIIKHWDELKEHVKRVYDAIKPIIESIKNLFGGLFDTITGGSEDAGFSLVNIFKTALDAIADVLNLIVPIVKRVIDVVGKILNGAVKLVKKILDRLKKFYYDHKKTIDTIAKVIGVIIEALVGVICVAADVIGGTLEALFEGLGILFDGFVSAIEGVCTFIGNTLGTVWDTITGVFDGIKETFGGIIDFITGVFTLDWEKAWDGIKSIFSGIWDALGSIATGVINTIIGAINALIDGINWLTGWIPELFGGEHDWIPNIPTLATGTENWRGGIVQISERGGEIVDLPKGSRVYPHDESVRKAYKDGMAASNSNSVTITIPKIADQVVVREEADVHRMARALARELEKASQNLGGSQISYSYQS